MQACKYACMHVCKYASMQVYTYMQVWKYNNKSKAIYTGCPRKKQLLEIHDLSEYFSKLGLKFGVLLLQPTSL